MNLIVTKQNKTKQNKLPSFIDRWVGWGRELREQLTLYVGCGKH
jgi:hypothetical protein